MVSSVLEDGEEPESEVDIDSFLEKQRSKITAQDTSSSPNPPEGENNEDEEDDDVDHTIGPIQGTRAQVDDGGKKSKKQVIEWDAQMEEMAREKEKADAVRGA